MQIPGLGPLPVPVPVGRFSREPTPEEALLFDAAPADQVPEFDSMLAPTFDEDLGPMYDRALDWSERYLDFFR